MKIVFVLLLAVAWLSTASASDCKTVKPGACKWMKGKHPDLCHSDYWRMWAYKNCKKFCGMCGPWTACDVKIAGKDNTMCIYKKGVFGPKCTKHGSKSDIKTGPLSKKLQKAFVDRTNKWRQKVASGKCEYEGTSLPAGTIPDVKWDDGVAAVAQRWADQCPNYMHPHDVNAAIKQFPAGTNQNAFISWLPSTSELTEAEIYEAIDFWYDEYKNFIHYHCPIDHLSYSCVRGKKSIDGVPGEADIGHFTQLIWAKTTDIGCGWIKYRDGARPMTAIICNYGKKMIFGDAIYKT